MAASPQDLRHPLEVGWPPEEDLDARACLQQPEPPLLVLGDLALLGLELGEDEPGWAHERQVWPATLRPLRERGVVGVPAVEPGELEDLSLEGGC